MYRRIFVRDVGTQFQNLSADNQFLISLEMWLDRLSFLKLFPQFLCLFSPAKFNHHLSPEPVERNQTVATITIMCLWGTIHSSRLFSLGYCYPPIFFLLLVVFFFFPFMITIFSVVKKYNWMFSRDIFLFFYEQNTEVLKETDRKYNIF